MAASEAYRTRDLPTLEKLAAANPSGFLSDYIAFWWIEARLPTGTRPLPPAEVRRFLLRAEGPLPDVLRADWLKSLALQQDWTTLLEEAPAYSGSDPDIVCGIAAARAQAGMADSLDLVRSVWLSGRSAPASCEPVFARLMATGQISADEVMLRYQQALSLDNVALARRVNPLLASELQLPDEAFVQMAADPAMWLAREDLRGRSRSARLLELQALVRVARGDPGRARQLWETFAKRVPAAEFGEGWGRIGLQAALRLDADALNDFRRVRDGVPSDGELEWWVRIALRASAWEDVLRATDLMSETSASQPVWRYWRARALKALGRRDEALVLLTPVARDLDFYGQLAQEELGLRPLATGTARADADEVNMLHGRAGIQRALGLFRLGLQPEAAREWNFVLKGQNDRTLLAAAELARQVDWYDRMISGAERAGPDSDISLRYPLPFRDSLHAQAHERGVEDAWIYGLIRQESRFLADARSRVGATGLMQLMPATARWVAHRINLRGFTTANTVDVDTNLQLGVYYLHKILTDLGHPVLATAGYNAGPARVRRWLDTHAIEGAAFCESIPLAETRDYVKKVMANTSVYAQRLGQDPRPLRARLGTIQAIGSAPAPEPAGVESGFDAVLAPPPAGPPSASVMAVPAVAPPASMTSAPVTAPLPAGLPAVAPLPGSLPAVTPLPVPGQNPVVPLSGLSTTLSVPGMARPRDTPPGSAEAPPPDLPVPDLPDFRPDIR